jgi:hypothetical protein
MDAVSVDGQIQEWRAQDLRTGSGTTILFKAACWMSAFDLPYGFICDGTKFAVMRRFPLPTEASLYGLSISPFAAVDSTATPLLQIILATLLAPFFSTAEQPTLAVPDRVTDPVRRLMAEEKAMRRGASKPELRTGPSRGTRKSGAHAGATEAAGGPGLAGAGQEQQEQGDEVGRLIGVGRFVWRCEEDLTCWRPELRPAHHHRRARRFLLRDV